MWRKTPGEDLGGILHFYHEIRYEFVRNEDSRKGGIAVKDLYLAGGPYYGVQEVFSRIKGVVETTAGFANSSVPNPRKEDVENGKVQAVECVKVTYNPKKIDIGTLLSVFFTIVNPYTDGIQGKCTGPHYRTGIYYVSGEDTPQITYYMAYYQNRGNSRPMSESCLVFNEYENEKNIRPPIRTEARRLENFYAAPEEEQYFLRKNPDTYSPIDIKLLEETGTLEILT